MAHIMISLEREEIQERIPYMLICETASSARWNTGKRKRLWAERFTEQERDACNRMISQAKTWGLVKGVPDSVTMSPKTLELWGRLAEFCMEV